MSLDANSVDQLISSNYYMTLLKRKRSELNIKA